MIKQYFIISTNFPIYPTSLIEYIVTIIEDLFTTLRKKI